MLDILVGTVGLAILSLTAGLVFIQICARYLPEEFESEARDADTTDVRMVRPSGYVADHGSGTHNRALLQVQQDLQRDLLQRRREAADLAIFRAVKGGQFGSAKDGSRDPVQRPPAA